MGTDALKAVKFKSINHIYAGFWRWPNFTPAEFADSESGELVIVPDFMDWLQGLRSVFGETMPVSSGYRTEARQLKISGRKTGSHVDGMAADILCHGAKSHRLLNLALEMGAMGVGVHMHGDHDRRYLHLDCWLYAPMDTRPNLWTYP